MKGDIEITVELFDKVMSDKWLKDEEYQESLPAGECLKEVNKWREVLGPEFEDKYKFEGVDFSGMSWTDQDELDESK